MSAVTLHAAPQWRDAVLEQVRVTGLSLRRDALVVVAAVLGFGTVMVVSEIVSGGPGFDSDETFPTALFSFLFPFLVWRNDNRFGPAFLWTLPVHRRRLALAKVIAGFVWLMAAVAFFGMWLLALALLADVSPGRTIMRIPFIATIGAYLLGSALVLGLRHAVRWTFGTAALLFLMGMIGDIVNRPDDSEWKYVPGAEAFFATVQRFMAAWLNVPDSAQWAITTFLWFGAGLAALWAALSRHGERRRH
jgi:hypothetical protein